jgi:Protein of unknown function (DUF2723)
VTESESGRSLADRQRTRLSVLLGLTVFGLYALTLFPGVGGFYNHGDSAKFQFLGSVPGVGHPPGNPLYLALLWLVQRVPLGDAAVRANLASAACAAAAAGLLSDAAHRLRGGLAAVVAAAVFTLGGASWIFATEAEVYALAGLMVALVLHGLVRADEVPPGPAPALGPAVFALGVANHLSLVFALPALAWASWRAHREGRRITRRGVLAVAGAALCTLALYAALPLVHTRAVYSEYTLTPGFHGFWEFVTAKKYQGHVGLPSLEAALGARPAFVASILFQQWTAPLWLALPSAFSSLARRAPITGRFAGGALASWALFLFVYDIGDPQGLLVPMAAAGALALGVWVAGLERRSLAMALIALSLAPGVVLRVRQVRAAVPFDVLEDVLGDPGQELLDLPDLLTHVPAGALVTQPCTHYGCAQVVNYYRFAEPALTRKKLELVSLAGSQRSWQPNPPRTIDAREAMHSVVCTLLGHERDMMERAGAHMARIDRGTRTIGDAERERLPVFCSTP